MRFRYDDTASFGQFPPQPSVSALFVWFAYPNISGLLDNTFQVVTSANYSLRTNKHRSILFPQTSQISFLQSQYHPRISGFRHQ